MSASPPFRFELVTTAERLAEVEAAWSSLWARSSASIFQSHPWVSASWRSEAASLRVGLGWRGDELVAVLPLALVRRHGLRVLEWAGKERTDYCDALVAPELHAASAVRELWRGVAAAGGFDLAYLTHLLPDASARALLRAGGGRFDVSHRGESSLRVRAPGLDGEDWLAGRSKKTRQNHRRGRKLLEEGGPVRLRLVAPDEPLDPVLDVLVGWKRDWLGRTGNTSSILADGGAPLRALVDVLARAGALRLHLLECGGRMVAGSINFVEQGRLCVFFNAYDPDHDRASVGTLLLAEYVKSALDEGLPEVDFLCGLEEYKLRFSDAKVELASAVHGRTLLGRAAVAVDGWRARRRAAGRVSRAPAVPPKLGAGRLAEG